MRQIHILSSFLCLACAFMGALADTEIRNFRLPLPSSSQSLSGSNPTHTLNAETHQLNLTISHESPEKYIALQVDSTQLWTIRISWPASSPTRWHIDLFPGHGSEQVIAHLSASPLSPRMPHPFLANFPRITSTKTPSSLLTPGKWSTDFHLVLEPVLYGFIPQSSLPNVYKILVIGLIGLGLSLLVIRFLEEWVSSKTMDYVRTSEGTRVKTE